MNDDINERLNCNFVLPKGGKIVEQVELCIGSIEQTCHMIFRAPLMEKGPIKGCIHAWEIHHIELWGLGVCKKSARNEKHCQLHPQHSDRLLSFAACA